MAHLQLRPSSSVAVVVLGVAPGVALDGRAGVEHGDVGRLEDEIRPEHVQHDEQREQNTGRGVSGVVRESGWL